MRDEETRAQQEVTKNNNDCQGNAVTTLPAPSESEARTPFEMTYSDTESEHEQEQVLKKPKPDIAMPAPSSVNILTQLKLSLEKEQKEQNSPPDGESEGEDEDLLHHKSKEDLIAEIKILRAKLARSTRETRRLRQSLTMLRVLPKAVKKFTKLVDKAEELLKVPPPPGPQHTADSGAPAAAPPSPSPSSSTSSLLSSLSPAGSRISSSSLFSSPESPVREGAEPPQKKWFKIEKWQIDRFNKATPQKFVNDLMQARYTMEFMATHSVTGARSSSSKFRETKPAMNRAEVQEIIDVTKRLFPDMTDTIVRRMMGQKLNNCTKKYLSTKIKVEIEQVLKKPKPDIAMPAPSSVNILTQLKMSLEKEQKEQNSPPDGESEGEDEDLLHHKSKEDLIAEIKILRAKLARSTRETRRLRQSLTMLRVLPKAVKKFTKLVDKAEELLKVPPPPGPQHTADSGAPAAAPPSPSPSSSTSSLLSSLSPAGSRISSSSLFSSPESPVREGAEPPQKKWFKIEKWQIDRFNKATPQKFVNDLMQARYTMEFMVNDLMQARYTMEFMATHSVTGARSSSSKFRETKPAMNRAEVQEIIDVTKRLFPDMTDTIVRRMMGQKLNNCTKKYLSTKIKVEIVSP
ncbi:UNVERIFIED_CONTAM: hypothetical protein FKN15_015932 [Acipenser sinensis]